MAKKSKTKSPQFSDEMLEAIAEAEEMTKHPENSKTFETVEELMKDLNGEME